MPNNEYHLYIHNVKDSKKKVVSGDDSSGIDDAEKSDSPTKRYEGAVKAVKGMVSFAAVRGFANNLIGYEISQVSLRTGAVEYEQKLQWGFNMANKAVNIGMATFTGAKMGGFVGAAVGFVSSTMYTAISYAQRANTIATQGVLENISLGMASARVGVSGRRGERQ